MNRNMLLLGAAALVTAGLIAFTATAQRGGKAGGAVQTYDLPTMKVFRLGTSVLRLDTRTGEADLLLGPATATGTGNAWTKRIARVDGPTSGMLDVQTLGGSGPDGVFLVDVAGDRSWLLTWRGNQNGAWREIPQSPR